MAATMSDAISDSGVSDPTTIRRLYGRRQGHALRQGQAELFADLLPRLAVPTEGPITAPGLFGDDRPLWLEIGFGKGEHMAGQAAMRGFESLPARTARLLLDLAHARA